MGLVYNCVVVLTHGIGLQLCCCLIHMGLVYNCVVVLNTWDWFTIVLLSLTHGIGLHLCCCPYTHGIGLQ